MYDFLGKAVILARGLGMRMRAESGTELSEEQNRIAENGLKTLVPVAGGRTMLELIVNNLMQAGCSKICLVIGPEHGMIRRFCAEKNLNVEFIVQEKPLGTANAVLSAEKVIRPDELFLTVNSDNLYPVDSLRRLIAAGQSALIGFDAAALTRKSNIDSGRIARFATLDVDDAEHLLGIEEKPEKLDKNKLISMNAWMFSPMIFEACRKIEVSVRGEFELTSAVQFAIDQLGERFLVVRSEEGVVDLSSRADIKTAAKFLI